VDYADIFLQILKKYCHDYEVAIFSNFWHFSYLLWLFLICKYSRTKTRWFTKVLLSHIFADQDKTSNLRDWDSKNGKSRDQDHISRLHHCLTCSGETNIPCSKCNVHLYLNQWWSLETHICESWSRRLQVSRLWMLQRNSLVKFLKFNDFCLLHLQVRNNQNMSEKARNKKNSTQKWSQDSKQNFGKMLKSRVSEFLMKSRSQSFHEVLVSKVTLSTASLV